VPSILSFGALMESGRNTKWMMLSFLFLV
jgi:hypothetical protein